MLSLKNCESTCICGMQSGDLVFGFAPGGDWLRVKYHGPSFYSHRTSKVVGSTRINKRKRTHSVGLHATTKEKEPTQSAYTQQQKNPLSRPTRINKRKRTHSVGLCPVRCPRSPNSSFLSNPHPPHHCRCRRRWRCPRCAGCRRRLAAWGDGGR